MEKQKHEVVIRRPEAAGKSRSGQVVWAVILIGVGLVFLAANLGIFSIRDIGAVFGSLGGSVGSFFGSLGGTIGTFFGGLGSAIGSFFGGLGGAIGRLWPLVIILIGAFLLFRRGTSANAEDDLDE